MLIIKILSFVFLIGIIVFILRQSIAISYEKRIGRYALDITSNDADMAFTDKIINIFKKIIVRFRKILKFIGIDVRKYNKYIKSSKEKEISAYDFVTIKILIAITFTLLSLISMAFQSNHISLISLIVTFFVGYYVLDIYLKIDNKKYKKRIENDLLRAIIIMNNAFKAGKSTMQAIKIASEDLEEPIKSEFVKMYTEMQYGLGIERTFERFSKRVDIEEAKYIAATLAILNKTGGNIIKVFDSIEKTLYDKKRLKEELKNLTASSNLVVKILMVVPILFVFVIYVLNPSYFSILFDSTLGIIILLIIIIMFALYVFFLQKVLKVRV